MVLKTIRSDGTDSAIIEESHDSAHSEKPKQIKYGELVILG